MPEKKSAKKKEHGKTVQPGANRVHNDGLGDVWAALTGKNPAEIMPQVVATVIEAGGTRAAWQWKSQGTEHILMAWPQESPIRAAVLMAGPEAGRLKPISAVPLLEGSLNDLTVEEVVPRAEGMGADVGCGVIDGKNPLWFYNPLYGRDKDDLTDGVTHTFWLAGAALGIRRALLDELTITQGPRYEEYAAAWLEENPDKTRLDVPPLKVDVRGKRIIMPGRFFGEYEVRTAIEEVEDAMFDKMPVKILYLSFPFEDRPPLQFPLYASEFILKGFKPEKGQEIDAYVWLEGRIVDLPPANE